MKQNESNQNYKKESVQVMGNKPNGQSRLIPFIDSLRQGLPVDKNKILIAR